MKTEPIPEKIKALILKGEGIEIEFKTAQFELSKNTFESICAFLNRQGGHLILGVTNSGIIEGVFEDCIQKIKDSLVTSANSIQKLNPTYYLSPEVYEDENGNKIIYIRVPESSQVHNTNGRIFDRNEDGDLDITNNPDLIAQLYLRKKDIYSENKIFPFIIIDSFVNDLFQRVRKLASSQRPDHVWLELSNEELLKSAGLFRRDYQTGKEGYTLASVLLFGRDEVIQNVLPHYKTDAILREENIDRYDDRDEVRTNLIDSYDRLMAFVRKHLPDIFYQENDQRISPRDRIFREVIGNMLIHREYSNPFPAKFIIEEAEVIAENWNRPHGRGNIDPALFSPYPKNPIIAKFFKEIGRADELGSGIRNTYKYCNIYTKSRKPEFIEGDVFKTIIPIPYLDIITKIGSFRIEGAPKGGTRGAIKGAVEGAVEGVTEGVKNKLIKLLILIYIHEGNRVPFYAKEMDIPDKTIEGYIKRLRDAKLIKFSKDKAPHIGGYFLEDELKRKIKNEHNHNSK